MARKAADSKKRKKQSKARTSKNYIDNEEFLAEVLEYKKAVKDNGGKWVPVPGSLAKYYLLLAENIAQKWRFAGYTYREDLISEGVIQCIKYGHNFDPDYIPKNSKKKIPEPNPFCYFSQIVHFAFLQKVKKENIELYAKYHSFVKSELFDDDEVTSLLPTSTQYSSYKDHITEFMRNFDEYNNKPSAKTKNM